MTTLNVKKSSKDIISELRRDEKLHNSNVTRLLREIFILESYLPSNCRIEKFNYRLSKIKNVQSKLANLLRSETFLNTCIFCGNMWETSRPVKICSNCNRVHFDNDKIPYSWHRRHY